MKIFSTIAILLHYNEEVSWAQGIIFIYPYTYFTQTTDMNGRSEFDITDFGITESDITNLI